MKSRTVKPRTTAALAFGTVALVAAVALPAHAATHPANGVSAGSTRFIAKVAAGREDDVAARAKALGARVVGVQHGVHTIVVSASAGSLAGLRALPGVSAVAADRAVPAQSLGTEALGQAGSMANIARTTGADAFWKLGWTGKGVDVALIDTGVAPVPGLNTTDKVAIGPDLSFESNDTDLRYLDTYGHGTNMAGIIAGREGAAASGTTYAYNTANFYGMAPDARIVSIKLADNGGAVDVSQIIAGIDWLVQYGGNGGLNVRVLNLSYGVLSKQDAASDPLSWAAEQAWKAGITVVASVGNDSAAQVASPAYNPWVIAVGAADTKGTVDKVDDSVASFSNRAASSSGRAPDLVAPGVNVVSLADNGGYLANTYPAARIGSGQLRGSGTSQAAAVVSGAVALLLSQRNNLNPDSVKYVLRNSSRSLTGQSALAQGTGELDLARAMTTVAASSVQTGVPNGNGTGSLDKARGDSRVSINGVALSGEKDIMGRAWTASMATVASSRNAWTYDGTFNGVAWTGTGFATSDGSSWVGKTWQGKVWVGKTWQGEDWVGKTWQSRAWNAATWNGSGWATSAWGSPTSMSGWAGVRWGSASWK